MSKDKTEIKQATKEGVATFYGVPDGGKILNLMAEYFEASGAGRHGANVTASGIIHMLLDGELDVVRVSDGKGFWHEEGYDKREDGD